MITLNKNELKFRVLNFLKEHELAVIATSSLDGRPEAATVGYVVDDNLNFIFITRRNSRKIRHLIENPKIALVVGTSKGLNTVQAEGNVEVLYDDNPSFSETVTKIANAPPLYYGPLLKMEGTEFAIIKFTPGWLRWLDVNELSGKEEFFQLLP